MDISERFPLVGVPHLEKQAPRATLAKGWLKRNPGKPHGGEPNFSWQPRHRDGLAATATYSISARSLRACRNIAMPDDVVAQLSLIEVAIEPKSKADQEKLGIALAKL